MYVHVLFTYHVLYRFLGTKVSPLSLSPPPTLSLGCSIFPLFLLTHTHLLTHVYRVHDVHPTNNIIATGVSLFIESKIKLVLAV